MKRDFRIKNYADRLKFITNENNLDDYDRSKWLTGADRQTSSGGEDYTIESLANYLLRSSDIDSERSIPYSFYRDKSEFLKEYWYRSKDISENEDRDYPISEDFVFRMVLHDFTSEESNNKLNYFEGYTVSEPEGQLEYISKKLISNAKDDKDIEVIYCLFDGMTVSDISNETGMSWHTVRRRIDRLIEQ